MLLGVEFGICLLATFVMLLLETCVVSGLQLLTASHSAGMPL